MAGTCSIEACNHAIKSLGLCGKHLARKRRWGTTDYVSARGEPKKAQGCSVLSCAKPHKSLGLCNTHYAASKREPPPLKTPWEERFWSFVDKTGDCWLWTGGKLPRGYGLFRDQHGDTRKASRLAYEMTYGSIPEGMHVLHHCDVPECVRPIHLWLGTHADNMADMAAKGRARSGRTRKVA